MSDTPQALPDGMNATLSRVAGHALAAHHAALEANFFLTSPHADEHHHAVASSETAAKEAGAVLGCLQSIGVTPTRLQQKNAGALDLAQLANLDTPEARELLALLERAQIVGQKVDEQRRHVVALEACGPGEPTGTHWSESLHHSVLMLRGELDGPAGRE